MKKNSLTQVPFDATTNNMLEYVWNVYNMYEDPRYVWKPNEPFRTEMHIVTYERGRSAARMILEDAATGIHYPMFLSDFVAMTQAGRIKYGSVSGQWIAVKKGSNYGIQMVSE
jgi:hypothetical protein